MKILVLDNYDSFVYNLVHILRELGYTPDVIRNDKITLDEVGKYDKILLSPGPGVPSEAGIMLDVIKRYAPEKSILGVCLGHQGIGEAFGSPLSNMDVVLHGFGVTTNITVDDYIFDNVPKNVKTGRYHSWVVDDKKLSNDLEVTAMSEDNRIMALRHKTYDVRGVQFHPESILTEHGKQMVENWLKHEKKAIA